MEYPFKAMFHIGIIVFQKHTFHSIVKHKGSEGVYVFNNEFYIKAFITDSSLTRSHNLQNAGGAH